MFPIAFKATSLTFLVMPFCYKYMNVFPIIPLSSNTKRSRIRISIYLYLYIILIHYTFKYFNILFYYKFIHLFINQSTSTSTVMDPFFFFSSTLYGESSKYHRLDEIDILTSTKVPREPIVSSTSNVFSPVLFSSSRPASRFRFPWTREVAWYSRPHSNSIINFRRTCQNSSLQ